MFIKTILMVFTVVILGSSIAQSARAQNSALRILSVDLSSTEIVVACRSGQQQLIKTDQCNGSRLINVRVSISGDELKNVKFEQTVSGGRIVQGSVNGEFVWDMTGVSPGAYGLTVRVAQKTSNDFADNKTVMVAVSECPSCGHSDPACPEISVSGPTGLIRRGDKVKFVAELAGGDTESITLNWTVSEGTIISGQGTPSISVDTSEVAGGRTIIATVELSGIMREGPGPCPHSASETVSIAEDPKAQLHREYKFARDIQSVSFAGFLYAEDLWSNMHGYFVELSNNPIDHGQIFIYGPSPASIAKLERAIRSFIRFRNLDSSRFTFLHGGYERRVIVQLWLVPPGAETPIPIVDHSNDIPPVLVNEFSSALSGVIKRNLDGFFAELRKHPDDYGEIHIYAPTLARYRTIERIINGHIRVRRFDKERISVERVTGKSTLIRLWRIAPGGEPGYIDGER